MLGIFRLRKKHDTQYNQNHNPCPVSYPRIFWVHDLNCPRTLRGTRLLENAFSEQNNFKKALTKSYL